MAGTDAIGLYGVVFGIFRFKLLPHPLSQIMAEFFGVQFADTLKHIITCPEDCAKSLWPNSRKNLHTLIQLPCLQWHIVIVIGGTDDLFMNRKS